MLFFLTIVGVFCWYLFMSFKIEVFMKNANVHRAKIHMIKESPIKSLLNLFDKRYCIVELEDSLSGQRMIVQAVYNRKQDFISGELYKYDKMPNGLYVVW